MASKVQNVRFRPKADITERHAERMVRKRTLIVVAVLVVLWAGSIVLDHLLWPDGPIASLDPPTQLRLKIGHLEEKWMAASKTSPDAERQVLTELLPLYESYLPLRETDDERRATRERIDFAKRRIADLKASASDKGQ